MEGHADVTQMSKLWFHWRAAFEAAHLGTSLGAPRASLCGLLSPLSLQRRYLPVVCWYGPVMDQSAGSCAGRALL